MTAEQSLVKDLQRALNGARKDEGRVKRVLSEKEKKIKLWEEWQRDVKSKFLQERKRHLHDLVTLDKELQDALSQQEVARALVRRVAAEEQGQEDSSQGPMETESEDCFERLMMSEIAADPWEDFNSEEVLKRALSEAPAMHATPRTPCPMRPPAGLQQVTATTRVLAQAGRTCASQYRRHLQGGRDRGQEGCTVPLGGPLSLFLRKNRLVLWDPSTSA